MIHNQKIGKFGEDLARQYLERKGYSIVDLNYKNSYQEIDIIAKIKKEIVFFEVKTRVNLVFGPAEEAISQKKLNCLKKAIGDYLYKYHIDPESARLDFLAIDIDKNTKKAKIKHFKAII
jgi:putative endonuclease